MSRGADFGRAYGGRRVLVVGATGFVGRWVARELTRAGADLVCAVRDAGRAASSLGRWGIQGRTLPVDLETPGEAASLVRDTRPEFVFNLAGYGVDPGERDEIPARRMNAELPAALAEALAPLAGSRFVHTGSALEYGEATGDLEESTATRATTLYGRTKLEGTNRLRAVCASHAVRGLTARLFTVYGPGEHAGRLLPTLLAAIADRTPIELTGGLQQRDFTWVGDVAEGLLRLALADTGPGAVVNLATGRLTPVRDFVLAVADVAGIARERLRFGALPTRHEEMRHEAVSVRRLQDVLGWIPPTTIREGVGRTLDFARQSERMEETRDAG